MCWLRLPAAVPPQRAPRQPPRRRVAALLRHLASAWQSSACPGGHRPHRPHTSNNCSSAGAAAATCHCGATSARAPCPAQPPIQRLWRRTQAHWQRVRKQRHLLASPTLRRHRRRRQTHQQRAQVQQAHVRQAHRQQARGARRRLLLLCRRAAASRPLRSRCPTCTRQPPMPLQTRCLACTGRRLGERWQPPTSARRCQATTCSATAAPTAPTASLRWWAS
mmetsp:Transcript_39971/g.119015  ORF Transcript_39971/g.119015 Transcript_39971/m.119015 type:complete len:221 (+) Transcript_39971:1074-1736(+)